eukprot:snap_masked-scaffold_58-processed-gene-0.33-mRNA-1 protein AED:1.00 eAED:1.00 QI:0/-1/0/0/-1/1/1/0/147
MTNNKTGDTKSASSAVSKGEKGVDLHNAKDATLFKWNKPRSLVERISGRRFFKRKKFVRFPSIRIGLKQKRVKGLSVRTFSSTDLSGESSGTESQSSKLRIPATSIKCIPKTRRSDKLACHACGSSYEELDRDALETSSSSEDTREA